MNPIVRNILAAIAGIAVGIIVNLGLVNIGASLIPAPDGVDISTPESIRAGLDQFELRHFIFPLLAHALGTLAGAFTAAKLAVSRPMAFGLGIGIFFLIGGITNLFTVPTPTWFGALDLIVAYLPMGWLGGRLGATRS